MTTLPPLWNHQQIAINRASLINRFALFFDPGCGKSRTALELYGKSGIKNLLIFAPLNVCRNWVNEIKTYLPGVFEDKYIFVVAGQTKEKKRELILEHGRALKNNKASVLIINTECLRTKDYTGLLYGLPCEFIICDESHYFKGWKSKQTLGLLDLVKKKNPKHLYLLTGTPAPQGEIDLWSSFVLLGKTNLPFFVWRKKYFDDKNIRRAGTSGYYPDYVIRESSKVEFRKLLETCSATAKKDMVLDLPPLLHLDVFCELGKEQRKHYDTMLKFLFAADELGNELNAANVLTRTLRLQQIIAGFLGDDVPVKTNPRLDALEYAINQTAGEQFIIWTIFKATYKQLSAFLTDAKISHSFLTGEQSAADRQTAMEEFQAGKLRCLVAHPRAGGVGVNLTAAAYSIHYTKNFNLVDDLQCEARNYRGGSEVHKKITRIDIIAEDTIDEVISDALKGKKDIQDFILGLKKYGKQKH